MSRTCEISIIILLSRIRLNLKIINSNVTADLKRDCYRKYIFNNIILVITRQNDIESSSRKKKSLKLFNTRVQMSEYNIAHWTVRPRDHSYNIFNTFVQSYTVMLSCGLGQIKIRLDSRESNAKAVSSRSPSPRLRQGKKLDIFR